MAGLFDKAKNFVAEKVTDVPKPEANIEDLKLGNVSREGVTYQTKVGITNPYSQTIPICEITYVLKSGGREILSGKVPDPGSIAGKETTALDIPMLVPHSILASLVKDIVRDWDIDYDLVIGLVVDLPVIGNFTIPLHNKGEIKLPSLSDYM